MIRSKRSNRVSKIVRSKRSNRRSWIPISSFTSLFSSIFSTTNFISYCYYFSHNRMIFSLLFSFIIISIIIFITILFYISFITLFIILIISHYYRIIINLNFSLFFFFIISILLRSIYSTFLILY